MTEVVKLIDTQSSGGCELRLVRVRIPPSAPKIHYTGCFLPGSRFREFLRTCRRLALPFQPGSVIHCSTLINNVGRSSIGPGVHALSDVRGRGESPFPWHTPRGFEAGFRR